MPALPYVRQFTAAIISSLASFCAGGCYVWPAPLMVELRKPGGELYLSTVEMSWMVSLIDVGNIVTPIPCGYISDKIGRKVVLLMSAPFYIGAGLIIVFTRSAHYLCTTRFLQGMANGAVYSILPLYLGELAAPNLRGTVSIFFTIFFFLGILTTYICGKLATYQQLAWIITAEPIVFAFGLSFLPDTPYYHLLNKKWRRATKALEWFRGTKDQQIIQGELNEIAKEVSEEEAQTQSPWKQLLGTAIGLKCLGLATLVVASQVLGGFYNVLSYACDTIHKVDPDGMDGTYVSDIFTTITLLTTALAAVLVDKLGRRAMLLISGVISYFAASLTATFFFLHQKAYMDMHSYTWILYTAITILIASLNFALSNLIPTLQAELFPTHVRSLASALIAIIQAVFTSSTLFVYLYVEEFIGPYANYLGSAFFLATACCIIYLYFPETKGKTFAQIQEMIS